MIRKTLAVIAGYAAWTVLWLGGNALFFARIAEATSAGDTYEEAGPLLAVLVLSVFCSLVGGTVTAAIGRSIRAVWVTAVLLLVTGIGVQAAYWELMPAWYHLAFLALIVPLTVMGGWLVIRRRSGEPPLA